MSMPKLHRRTFVRFSPKTLAKFVACAIIESDSNASFDSIQISASAANKVSLYENKETDVSDVKDVFKLPNVIEGSVSNDTTDNAILSNASEISSDLIDATDAIEIFSDVLDATDAFKVSDCF